MRILRLGPLMLLLAAMAPAARAPAANGTLTVAQLTAFIKSSVELKQQDKQVVMYLKTVKLSERLDDRTVEDYQGMGVGPKTLAELEHLRDESATLRKPPPPAAEKPPPPPAPPPDSITQGKIIDAAREYAMSYTKQLPNFLCAQVTRRYWDPANSGSWGQLDTITQKLSYYDQEEHYETISVSGRGNDDLPLSKLGGVTSSGEFGSQMREIFDPGSHADFSWDHWGKLRAKLQYVFAYRVPQQYSHYRMTYNNTMEIVPGYQGLIYIDEDTGLISRLTLEPVNIPSTFPVLSAKTTLDYDYAEIGESVFLLPLRAELISTQNTPQYPRLSTRNDIEFRLYRKFGAEAKITFAPDALPDDKVKDEPVDGATAPAKAPAPKPPAPGQTKPPQ